MKALTLIVLACLTPGCGLILPDSSVSATRTPDLCSEAWDAMKPDQQTLEGDEALFTTRCANAALLARCNDGYIDRTPTSVAPCIGHKGVARILRD